MFEPNLTVSGKIYDDTRATMVLIQTIHEFRWAGGKDSKRQVYKIKNPGESFSKRVFLGVGKNKIIVTVTDQLGNEREYEFTVYVADLEPPTIKVNDIPDRVTTSNIVVSGVVRDNVKMGSLRFRLNGLNLSTGYISAKPEVDRDMLSYPFRK
ncbi:MAG: hypothetical protein SXQ77_00025, partial [Halobacteria archaeon]|nr:hypothetical protein [Halobacteria archaeon]